jgi:hypothetical protein
MKTAEDEAFEDIERRQGGFHAKRQAAMDKINSDFDEEYIRYREASPKGYTAPQQEYVLAPAPGYCKNCNDYTIEEPLYAQPAQEPVACLDCGSNNVGIPATYDSLVDSVKSQPAQEPVAIFDELLGRPTLLSSAPMLEDGQPLYTTSPKRKWVGLTLDEIEELFQIAAGADEEIDIRFARLIEAKLKGKNG